MDSTWSEKHLLQWLRKWRCHIVQIPNGAEIKMAATDMGINNLPDSVGTSHPLFKQLNPHSAFFSGGIRQWILQISLDSAMNAADFLLILQ
ncbi:unnamed protein product [Lathyrus oleraceus]